MNGARPARVHRLVATGAAAAYAALSALGLVLFLSSRAPSLTPALGSAPPPGGERTNLAFFRRGARVETSSYAYLYIHHPLFAIDGITGAPNDKEEWVPDRRTDRRPWLAVHLGRPADIDEVVVWHEPRYTKRSYSVSCLEKGAVLNRTMAAAGADVRVAYPLVCAGADSVRLDFTWDPYDADGHIRLTEIEVWGR